MVANTYHWISFVRHAGHRVLAHPVRLPQTGHLIVISTSCLELKMAPGNLLQSLSHRLAGVHRVAAADVGPKLLMLTLVQSGQWSESFT